MKQIRKILALNLVLLMLCTMLPISALAAVPLTIGTTKTITSEGLTEYTFNVASWGEYSFNIRSQTAVSCGSLSLYDSAENPVFAYSTFDRLDGTLALSSYYLPAGSYTLQRNGAAGDFRLNSSVRDKLETNSVVTWAATMGNLITFTAESMRDYTFILEETSHSALSGQLTLKRITDNSTGVAETVAHTAQVTSSNGSVLAQKYSKLDAGNYIVQQTNLNGARMYTYELTVENAASAITAGDLTYTIPIDHEYTGNPQGIGEVTGPAGCGEITVKYDGSEELPVNAGTYAVTVDIDMTAGYSAVTDLYLGDYTIGKAAAPEITWPTASEITYGQTLSQSILVGGSTEYGTFVWSNGYITPNVINTGYEVLFLPNENTLNNYLQIIAMTKNINVSVEKAIYVETPTAILPVRVGYDTSGYVVAAINSFYDIGLLNPTFEYVSHVDDYFIFKTPPSLLGTDLTVICKNTSPAGLSASISIKISSENYNDIVAVMTVLLIDKDILHDEDISFADATMTYNGSPQSVDDARIFGSFDGGNFNFTYSYVGTGDTIYDESLIPPTNAGTYAVTVKAENLNYIGYRTATLTILPKELTADMLSIPTATYSGNPQTPALTVIDESTLIQGVDFTATLAPQTDAGSYPVTVTGTGNYTGTATANFEINKKDITGAAIVLHVTSFTYSGIEILPDISTVTVDGVELFASDYTVACEDNEMPGIATLTVSAIANGNFSGNASTTFTITAATPDTPVVTGSLSDNGQTYTYTVAPITGAVYKMDGGSWQESNVFMDITPGDSETHTFYAKLKESASHSESADGSTGPVSFPRLPQAAPSLAYSISGDFPNKIITITEVRGALYQFNSGGYSDNNIYVSNAEETVVLYIKLLETSTHLESPEAALTISTANADQAAPDVFKLIVTNVNDTTYTVTIPPTDGAEYSFDGTTYDATNIKTGLLPGETIVGYKRMAAKSGFNASTSVSNSETLALFRVKAPVANPNGGTFTSGQSVTLSSATPNAKIYYTLNGSTPTIASTEYTTAISITATTTVKAIAVSNGMINSEVMTVTITINRNSGGFSGNGNNGTTTIIDERTPLSEAPENIEYNDGGSVTVDDDGTIIITPDEGFVVKEILINGEPATVADLKNLLETDSAEVIFEWIIPYTDISTSNWFYDAVKYVSINSLMRGTGDDKFEPNATLSRAMLVTILWRIENEPEPEGDATFSDLTQDWYRKAVIWAAGNGIVEGRGDGTFAPEDDLTREQMAAILYRYAKYKGEDVSGGEDANILSYDDAFDISDWAFAPIQWACSAEIISGKTAATLDPKGTATRAETATILQRYLTK